MQSFRRFRQLLVATFMSSCLSNADAQQSHDYKAQGTATLRVKFLFNGNVPTPDPIDASRDRSCLEYHVPDERLIVNGEREIQNVVLLWDERKNANHDKTNWAPAIESEIEINNVGCRLDPHIIVARVGQELVLNNKDDTGHNTNILFFDNDYTGGIRIPNRPIRIKLRTSERAPMPVECNVHHWERAYLIVKTHPFVGVSDSDGVLEIKDLPVGTNWFHVWHECSNKAFESLLLNEEIITLVKGRFALELTPGVNDLGTVKLKDTQFKLPLEPLAAD